MYTRMFSHEVTRINRHYVCMILCESVRSDLFALLNNKLRGVRITTCREQGGCLYLRASNLRMLRHRTFLAKTCRWNFSGMIYSHLVAVRRAALDNRISSYINRILSSQRRCIRITFFFPSYIYT